MLDPVGQLGEEVLVVWHVFVGSVFPVGQEREVDMPGGIRQEMGLESLDGLFDVRAAREQGGHDHHGSEFRRHAVLEIELAEQAGGNDPSDQTIDEGHRDVRGWHQGEDPQEKEDRRACSRAPGCEQRAGESKSGQDADRPEVRRDRMGATHASQADSPRDTISQPLLEDQPATGQEVVPRVLLGAVGDG